jgi:hypothetical protein
MPAPVRRGGALGEAEAPPAAVWEQWPDFGAGCTPPLPLPSSLLTRSQGQVVAADPTRSAISPSLVAQRDAAPACAHAPALPGSPSTRDGKMEDQQPLCPPRRASEACRTM